MTLSKKMGKDQNKQSQNIREYFDEYYSAFKTNQSKAKAQANEIVKRIFKKELFWIRRYKLRLNLNKYKFEDKYLGRFSKFIGKLCNKEIEFNIINLKSIIFNTDLFTEVSTLKIKKKKSQVLRVMNIILNKAVLPRVNRIQEKGRIVKSVDPTLLQNTYKNIHLNSIMSDNFNLDKLFNKIFTNIKDKLSSTRARVAAGCCAVLRQPAPKKILYDLIFNSIKYKNMGGIRMEVRGRLTKRYRADRAVYKLK